MKWLRQAVEVIRGVELYNFVTSAVRGLIKINLNLDAA